MELGHSPPLSYFGHDGWQTMAVSGQLPAISIRRATTEDAPGILDCLRAAFEEYRGFYAHDAFLDTVLLPETLRERLLNMDIFVAIDHFGQIVGTVACGVIKGEEGHIRGMAVRPACHGAGIAAKLLSRVELELRELKCTCISLDTTEPLQRAMRFYEKYGFRRSGKITDFFGMHLIEYRKTLSSEDALGG